MSVPDWAPASAGESLVWQGRPRKRVVHLGFAVGVVAAAVVLGVAGSLWRAGSVGTAVLVGLALVAAVGLAVPTAAAFLWREHTHYLLTESALYHRTGVLWITVTELGLDQVQNTAYAQGVFGTLFDHGTVTVDTAGSEGAELRLRAMDDPAGIHRVIAERAVDAGGEDPVPGTVAQWKAVLDEVRRLRIVLDAE